MNIKNIFIVGSCFFLFSFLSFGVTINGQKISVKNRRDMKKVYTAAVSRIAMGHYG
jgi:hypothetical protein